MAPGQTRQLVRVIWHSRLIMTNASVMRVSSDSRGSTDQRESSPIPSAKSGRRDSLGPPLDWNVCGMGNDADGRLGRCLRWTKFSVSPDCNQPLIECGLTGLKGRYAEESFANARDRIHASRVELAFTDFNGLWT